MELRQLECFVAVVEESGFTRAAARLHVGTMSSLGMIDLPTVLGQFLGPSSAAWGRQMVTTAGSPTSPPMADSKAGQHSS